MIFIVLVTVSDTSGFKIFNTLNDILFGNKGKSTSTTKNPVYDEVYKDVTEPSMTTIRSQLFGEHLHADEKSQNVPTITSDATRDETREQEMVDELTTTTEMARGRRIIDIPGNACPAGARMDARGKCRKVVR